MSGEPLDSDFITIATWPGGYALERALTKAAITSVIHQDAGGWEQPVFVIRQNGLVHSWFRYSLNSHGPWGIHVLHPDPTHRRVLISALDEVLHTELPVSARGVRPSHSGTTAPIIIDGHELGWMLEAPFGSEQELLQISNALAQVHDDEMALPSSMDRRQLFTLRKKYNQVATDIILEMKLGYLSTRARKIDSAPGLWAQSALLFQYTDAQPFDDWWIVLALNLLPRPSWDVFFQKIPKYWRDYGGCGGVQFQTERIYLTTDAPGPVTAMLRANLVRSSGYEEREDWISNFLADAPEPDLVFDMEPYLLLEADLPILWSTPDFLEWVAAGHKSLCGENPPHRVPFPDRITPQRRRKLLELATLTEEQLYAVDTAVLDRAVFGFTTDDITRVPLDLIEVKYPGNLEAAEYEVTDPEMWRPHLREPIEVQYKGGVFYIEDGHHRYVAAKRLGETSILASIQPDDNPIIALEKLMRSLRL